MNRQEHLTPALSPSAADAEREKAEAEFAARIASVQSIHGSAAIQIGWTALIEAFTNHWEGAGMSATEMNVYVGASPHEFLKVGWLREERRASGSLFWPAGQLLDYLTRDVEQGAPHPGPLPIRGECGEGEEADPLQLGGEGGAGAVHISTVPFPHVVPTPTGTISVRESEPEASQSSPAPAGTATGVPLRGRWDDKKPGVAVVEGPPLSEVARELSHMIGALKSVSEEVRLHLLGLMQTQGLNGGKDINDLTNGVAHLRRLASDLFNHLGDAEVQLQISSLQRRSKGAR